MNDERLTETILGATPVFDGRMLHVEVLDVRLPDGSPSKREIVRHPGAAAVLPVWEDGTVTMVRQYRSPIDKVIWEIPAGKLDHRGEDTLDAAKRELLEETGQEAANWLKLTDIVTSVGFTDERIGLYAAWGLRQGQDHLDEGEFLHAQRIPFRKVLEDVLAGRIEDSKTVAAVLLANERIRRGEIPFPNENA